MSQTVLNTLRTALASAAAEYWDDDAFVGLKGPLRLLLVSVAHLRRYARYIRRVGEHTRGLREAVLKAKDLADLLAADPPDRCRAMHARHGAWRIEVEAHIPSAISTRCPAARLRRDPAEV